MDGRGQWHRACLRAILLNDGWSVVLTGRREAPLIETAQGHARASVVCADVSVSSDVERLFEAVVAQHGRLDCSLTMQAFSLPGP